jgi:hypothetical protein
VVSRSAAWLAALACAGAPGCGTVIEYETGTTDFLADGDRATTAAGEHDCDAGAGYTLDSYVAQEIEQPELHIVGIHTAYRGLDLPFGQATIRVERPGPSVLVLSAYEPTRWIVEPGPGAVVERVIATGYKAQQISAPAGIEVEIVDIATAGDLLGLAVVWPSEMDRDGSCTDFFSPAECDLFGGAWRNELDKRVAELTRLVERAEDRTGLSLSTFHGCHSMSELALVP